MNMFQVEFYTRIGDAEVVEYTTPPIGSSLIDLETSSLKMTLRIHYYSEEPSSTRENLALSSGFVGGIISRKNVPESGHIAQF